MMWPAIPLLALLLGLANHDRGRGTLPGGRIACAVIGGGGIGLTAALMGFPLQHAAAIAGATTLGFYNWLVWGWGLYFAAFTGTWKKDEEEIGWIDSVCMHFVPFVTESRHSSNYLRGWLGMTLRGLYLIPMFLLFDPLHGFTPNAVWLLGLLGPLQGVIYAANRIANIWQKEGTAYPELVMGALIGALSGAALVILAGEVING